MQVSEITLHVRPSTLRGKASPPREGPGILVDVGEALGISHQSLRAWQHRHWDRKPEEQFWTGSNPQSWGQGPGKLHCGVREEQRVEDQISALRFLATHLSTPECTSPPRAGKEPEIETEPEVTGLF